jgi:hypothetical protein
MAPTNHGPFDSIFKLFPSIPILSEEQPHHILREPNGHVFTYSSFQDLPIHQNCLVDGWRQSARYFPSQGISAALEQAIPVERQKELFQRYSVERESMCFLHVRLGDYQVLPHHQIDIGSYIKKASEQFPPQTKFLVFSDEAAQHKQVLENLVLSLGHVPTVVEESDELEALFLMSQCWGGAIVANSTFSWWGAYFARKRCPDPSQYKAYYPAVWGAGLPPARDVVPSWGTSISFP